MEIVDGDSPRHDVDCGMVGVVEVEDVQCPLCQHILFQPYTTPCGHTFCRSCILRASDYRNQCPICRSVLFLSEDLSPNVLLKSLLEKMFPSECAQREADAASLVDVHTTTLPLFICDPSVMLAPCQNFPLYLFELRYRRMLEHCLGGERSFGVVAMGQNVGTLTSITGVYKFADGRATIHTKGTQRFRIMEQWTHDESFQCARVQLFSDEPLQDDSLSTTCASLVKQRLTRLTRTELNLLETQYGRVDLVEPDGEKLSLWLFAVLPFTMEERVDAFCSTSSDERLKRCIERMSADEWCFVLPKMTTASRKRSMWVVVLFIALMLYGFFQRVTHA